MGGYAVKLSDVVSNRFSLREDESYFGIEIEVENACQPDDVMGSLWTTVHDGSLRGAGLEFLSKHPWTMAQVCTSVPQFYEWRDKFDFTSGIRTSTHVHANVLHKTGPEIAAICTLYTLVEPLLFRYCGPLREANIYCVPWYRAPDQVQVVRDIHEERWHHVSDACKYSALYLEPLLRFGTLEFRQAPVFDCAGGLLQWVDMVHRIVECGYADSEAVLKAFEELSVDRFVEVVFGERLAGILRGACETDFEELLERYDVETTAELSCCTYNEKATRNRWFLPSFEVEGEGTAGYHLRQVPPGSFRMRDEEFIEEQPELYYDDDEEDY
jgi:hypothetical protein